MCALYIFLASFLTLALTAAAEDRIVCYYGSWARSRVGNGRVTPNDMDASLCTHFIWSFGILSRNELKLLEQSDEDNLRAFVQLRQRNPSAKILIAVGGYTDSQDNKYSLMAASKEYRKKFINSVITLLKKFKLDGLDVDWEYPQAADKANFVLLLKELRERFNKEGGYLLTAAVGASGWRADESYDIPAISKQLDFINLMTYDFHGSWEAQTGHHANLRGGLYSVESSVAHWLTKGCPKEKLVVGVPTYGQTWTLSNPKNHGPGVPTQGKGMPGPYMKTMGSLGYNEICEGIKKGEWKVEFDEKARAPFAYKRNQWVSYDNVKSVSEKANYIKQSRLGGAMIWAIETDDTRGACGEKYPILKTLNAVLRDGASVPEEPIPPTVDEIPEEPPVPELSGPNSSDLGQRPNQVRGTGVCTQPGNIPDPESCGFISCVNDGQGSLMHFKMACPHGLCYNELTNWCDY